jgi:hypothetical protein
MPRDIETFSKCAPPGVARPHTELGGIAGFLIDAWYFSGALSIIGLAATIVLLAVFFPEGLCLLAAALMVALTDIKHWYYNERLLCIADEQCAVGTVISKPEASFDGDRKLNLALAPFTQLETRLTFLDHLDRNRTMLSDAANFTDGFHGTVTTPMAIPTRAEITAQVWRLEQYLGWLDGSDPDGGDQDSNMYNQLLIGMVDTMLLPSNVGVDGQPKGFQSRFYRTHKAPIDPGTLAAIPRDYDPSVNWQGNDAQSSERLNPMFRFDDKHTVPYLHCEVEGNYVAILLDDFILSLNVYTAACAIPIIGPGLAFLAGWIAWLLKNLIDYIAGNDGDAAEPDIDWDDPDATGEVGVTQNQGDVVVTFGGWIMDTEHGNYFEIHPVTAYYLVARDERAPDEPVLVDGNEEQEERGLETFDPSRITQTVRDEICGIVTRAEDEDPDDVVVLKAEQALSWGMNTRYAGGGVDTRIT